MKNKYPAHKIVWSQFEKQKPTSTISIKTTNTPSMVISSSAKNISRIIDLNKIKK